MNIEMVRDGFLWCTLINNGVLLVWFLVFILAARFHAATSWPLVSIVETAV